VVQQRLIDQVAGELGVAAGVLDRLERRCGIRQHDAGATAAEVQQSHHTVWAQPGVGMERRQRRDGVGDQPGRHAVWRQAWVGPHRVAQRPQGRRSPVRRNGDRGLRRRLATGGFDHRLQSVDQQLVGVMRRTVGGHQRDRVADPLHEAAQHDAVGVR
jgi:hypothetical protein